VEAFRQSGRVRTGLGPAAPEQAVSAWFVHADAGYSFKGPRRPRVSFEFDMASGDRAGGRQGRFDTLFGMRRADYAPSGLYSTSARTNIVAPGIRLEGVRKRTDGLLTYHPMWLASSTDSFATTAVRDPRGRSGRFAGHQLDARVRHWLIKDALRFEFDGVLLRKGRFLRRAPNAPPKAWTRYLSFNLLASF
jgi:hypothetical protein